MSRQPDDATPRVYGMRPAREVQQHGEGFVTAGWLAEDDRAVFLVQYDDGIGPEDHRVWRFGPGGAGYGFGLGLCRPPWHRRRDRLPAWGRVRSRPQP